MAKFYNPFTGQLEESKFSPQLGRINRSVLRKQARLLTAGIPIPEEEKPSRFSLQGLLDLLSRGEYASATTVGDILKYGTLPSLQELKEAVTGKKKYTYDQLLEELGMKKGIGRSVLAFGLGTVLDPLTYIPLSAIARPIGRLAKPIGKFGLRIGKRLPMVGPALEAGEELAKWGKRAVGVKKYADEGVRQIDDLLKGISGRISHRVTDVGKKYEPLLKALGRLSDEEARLVTFARESKSLRGKLSKSARETLSLIDKMLKETGEKKLKKGIVKELIGRETTGMPKQLGLFKELTEKETIDYLPHMVTQEFYDKVIKQRPTARPEEAIELLRGLIRKGLPRREKSRNVLRTIYQLNKWSEKKYGVKMFEEDIKKIIPKYLYSYSKNTALYDLAMDLTKIKSEAGEQLIRHISDIGKVPKGMVKLTGLPFNGEFVTTPEVAKEINKVVGVLSSDVFMNKFARYFDKLMRYWKTSVTIPWPSFNISNLIGAEFNNFIQSPTSLKKTKKVFDILAGKPMKIVAKNGKSMTSKEFLEELYKRGALLTYAGFDITPPKLGVKTIGKRLSQLTTKYAGGIERFVRTQLALDTFERTGSIDKAIRAVWKVHGNYAPEALTAFERNYLKRIIPFYTWLKTNLPFQLENLYKKTGRYAMLARAERQVSPKREEMPEWLRDKIVVAAKDVGLGKKAIKTLDLPIADIFKMTPRKFFSSVLNPLMRVPLELVFNKSIYTGKPIVDEELPREYQTSKAYEALTLLPKPLQKWLRLKEVEYKNRYTGKFEKRYEADAKRLYLLLNLIGPLSRWYYTSAASQREVEALGKEGTKTQRIMAEILPWFWPVRTYTYSPAETKYWEAKGREAQLQNVINYLLRRGLIQPARR